MDEAPESFERMTANLQPADATQVIVRGSQTMESPQ